MTEAEREQMEDCHCNAFADPQQERRDLKQRQAYTAKLVAAMTDAEQEQRAKEDKENPMLALLRMLNGDDRDPVDETTPDRFAAGRLEPGDDGDEQYENGFFVSFGDDDDDDQGDEMTIDREGVIRRNGVVEPRSDEEDYAS